MHVKTAINKRKSIRNYSGRKVEKEEIEELINAAKKAPSAGGIRPIEIYVIDDPKGLNTYNAPHCFVLAADFPKTKKKYGSRGKRYVWLEAGHMAQNIALRAVERNLATCMIGAFKDKRVKKMLKTDKTPLYIIAFGERAEK